jgi:predicted dehydrogenase
MIKIAILGTGNRGYHAYGKYMLEELSDKIKVVAVCDKNPTNFKHFSDAESFSCDKEFLSKRRADALLICTQDKDHYGHAMKALDLGYHILLEKPISPSLSECFEIAKKAREKNLIVTVCHVLRYTPFFSAVKKTIDSGVIGKVIHYTQVENIGYFHFAHSYVRGNWRNEKLSSPLVLAKTCHDLDIINDMSDGKPIKRVTSTGSLLYFKKENAPIGSTDFCLGGCAVKENCPYDAETIYLKGIEDFAVEGLKNLWPHNVVCTETTHENLRNAIKSGAYGRCVFKCDNDVVDNQHILIEYEDGTTATLEITPYAAFICREVRVRGTLGEIIASEESGEVKLRVFGQDEEEIEQDYCLGGGHGGGDWALINDFVSVLEGGDNSAKSRTSIENSLISHALGAASEISRKEHKVVDFQDFLSYYK